MTGQEIPLKERPPMKRVVESLPDPARMADGGLTQRDFRVDAETYGRFAERYRREFAAFARQFQAADPPETAGDPLAAPEEPAAAACQAAFEASLPPFEYHQGVFYRCRADRSSGADQPILLERYEREEITGWAGIPPGPYHRNTLLMFLGWAATWFGGGRSRETGKETRPR